MTAVTSTPGSVLKVVVVAVSTVNPRIRLRAAVTGRMSPSSTFLVILPVAWASVYETIAPEPFLGRRRACDRPVEGDLDVIDEAEWAGTGHQPDTGVWAVRVTRETGRGDCLGQILPVVVVDLMLGISRRLSRG
jgi:hypothetical protein